MNPTTQQVIEFLSHSELPFGAEEDVLILSDPEMLHERVASLLGDYPAVLGREKTENLQGQLAQADWPFVAQEFRARVEATSLFFDGDAQAATGRPNG